MDMSVPTLSKFSNDLEVKNWSQKRNRVPWLSWLDNLLPLVMGYSCKREKRPISSDFINDGFHQSWGLWCVILFGVFNFRFCHTDWLQVMFARIVVGSRSVMAEQINNSNFNIYPKCVTQLHRTTNIFGTSYLAFWGEDRPQTFYRDRSTAVAKLIYLLVTEATTLYESTVLCSYCVCASNTKIRVLTILVGRNIPSVARQNAINNVNHISSLKAEATWTCFVGWSNRPVKASESTKWPGTMRYKRAEWE